MRPTAASNALPAAAETNADSFSVLLFSIDVRKGTLVCDGNVADRGGVRAHDRLGSGREIRGAQRGKHRALDEQWMAVAIAGSGPHNRRARSAVRVDHRAHRSSRHERYVHERD